MNFISIIGMFFPSLIGIFILEYLNKNLKVNKKRWFYLYGILVVISNVITCIICRYAFDFRGELSANMEYPMFFAKYAVISLIINMILSIIVTLVIKYISVSIEVEYHETR